MSYLVKEIFYTLQGEGANSGRAAVFCRFAGCNLWSGREEDRDRAVCRFCDTDFVGTDGTSGGRFESAAELAAAVDAVWRSGTDCGERRFVVCTGGEPLLQLDATATVELHKWGFEIAIETNGTRPVPPGVDWVCVSPKAGSELVVRAGHELKLVFPQPGAEPERFESLDFRHFILQAMDGPDREVNVRLAADHCLRRPHWRLGLQIHKLIGLR